MARSPEEKAREKALEKKQEQNKQVMIVCSVVGCLILGFIVVGFLMKEDRGLVLPSDREPPPPAYEPKRNPLKPVAMAARPIVLADQYLKAIGNGDRRFIANNSVIENEKLDLLLEKERVDAVSMALGNKTIEWAEPKVEGSKARVEVTISNPTNLPVESLAFVLENQGSTDDGWKVVRVENRYYASSGKVPEKGFVAMGENRASVAAPLDNTSSFRMPPEMDPTMQDWVPGTTEAQKTEITGLVQKLADPNSADYSRVSARLVEIGKPAIPQLLNVFTRLDVRKEDDNLKANAVDRTLARLTDLEMGYDAVGLQGAAPGALPPALARVRAVRRWFGWWDKHKNDPIKPRLATEEK